MVDLVTGHLYLALYMCWPLVNVKRLEQRGMTYLVRQGYVKFQLQHPFDDVGSNGLTT